MLEKQTVQTVSRAVRDADGREVCGFILRLPNGMQQFIRAGNLSPRFASFEISNSEVLRIHRYAQRQNSVVEAFLHSHRSTLHLSDKDRSSMIFSHLPWIVVVLTGDILRYRVFTNGSDQNTFKIDQADDS